MTLGEKIRHYRKCQGLSLNKVSELSGISKAYLSQLENGKNKQPSANILLKLSEVLKTTIQELMEKPIGSFIPDSLQELIDTKKDELDIRDEDIKMLSCICYRGRYPATADDYEYILKTIRFVIGE